MNRARETDITRMFDAYIAAEFARQAGAVTEWERFTAKAERVARTIKAGIRQGSYRSREFLAGQNRLCDAIAKGRP